MRNILYILGLSSLVASSCGLKGSGETEKSPQILTVEFKGIENAMIKNNKGKAMLYAVPADVADVKATLINQVDFETASIPFSVDFEIPADHVSMIKPEIIEGAPVKYYVSMDWDSNGDGKQDSLDVAIDFNKKFPDIDISQIHQEVFVK